jgi:hypothetical protein
LEKGKGRALPREGEKERRREGEKREEMRDER